MYIYLRWADELLQHIQTRALGTHKGTAYRGFLYAKSIRARRERPRKNSSFVFLVFNGLKWMMMVKGVHCGVWGRSSQLYFSLYTLYKCCEGARFGSLVI